MPRWTVTKNGRKPGVPTVLPGPGGTSASLACVVVPRMERPAVTRDDTTLLVNETVTSEVGSANGAAPPALAVRAKKRFVEAPAGTSAFWIGLKYDGPEKLKVPGGPLATMSENQAITSSKIPAFGTRMPRSSVGNPPFSA